MPQSPGQGAMPCGTARGQEERTVTASCAVTPPPVPAEHSAPETPAPSGRGGPLVAASPEETAAVPAPPAAPDEDLGVDPACGSDLQAICDAYRRATGLADLCPEALRGIAQRRALSAAYVAAKLALLQAAIAAGEVRHARGYFLAALDRDWTEQTAHPGDRHGQQDTTPQDPEPTPPDDTDLITALTGVGVTSEAAARLAHDNPDGARRQLRWLPQRKARPGRPAGARHRGGLARAVSGARRPPGLRRTGGGDSAGIAAGGAAGAGRDAADAAAGGTHAKYRAAADGANGPVCGEFGTPAIHQASSRRGLMDDVTLPSRARVPAGVSVLVANRSADRVAPDLAPAARPESTRPGAGGKQDPLT